MKNFDLYLEDSGLLCPCQIASTRPASTGTSGKANQTFMLLLGKGAHRDHLTEDPYIYLRMAKRL